MSKMRQMLLGTAMMALAAEAMANEQIYCTGRRRLAPNNDSVNYAGNIIPYVSKPIRKGAGKKKLSKKQRKAQNKQ